MRKLEQYQGMIFDGSNMPEFYRYIADYLEEHPDCTEGFGVEFSVCNGDWVESDSSINIIINSVLRDTYRYRPAPLTRTMYNIHTGEAVEVPIDFKYTVISSNNQGCLKEIFEA